VSADAEEFLLLEALTRERLVKSVTDENTRVCVTVNCKV
jgi:hypothetical protein